MINMNKENSILKVHKHNGLIRARYSVLTLPEQLLLLAVIGKVDPRELTAETSVELTVSAFKDITDNIGESSYDELRKAVRRLYNRSVIISDPDPEDPSLTETETRWVSSINYYKNEGRVRLFFAPKILPYLANLKDNYTAYFLKNVSKFRSGYSIRLYEMIIQWQSIGSVEIEINELRRLWMLEEKYLEMCDFKKRVIEPALKDINEFSNVWAKMEQKKRGRRIHSLKFRFGLKQSQSPKTHKLTKAYIEKNARPGESWEEATARLKKHKNTN